MYYALTIIVVIVFIAIIIFVKLSGSKEKRKVHKNNVYAYIAKDIPMTVTEADFFHKLTVAVDERYFVFPQIHLSAILRSTAYGQEGNYAFRHINGKSVDYVLCDKETLRPAYAVELDDYTHSQPARRKRDAEVERIFAEADLPLVRFKNKNVSAQEIIDSLMRAHKA